MPNKQQISRINDALYFIHNDITADLSAANLSRQASYTEQHFHRLFKQVVGEPVHHYVRRIRLENAANQLMFSSKTSIIDIAIKCGFLSLSSFSKAFKQYFSVTPGQWRKSDQPLSKRSYLSNSEIAKAYQHNRHHPLPRVKLKRLPPRLVAYIRHQGYDRSIKNAWQQLTGWALAEGIEGYQEFGLHHSNPTWVALNECRYVACIGIDKPLTKRSRVNSMTIPGGLHAVVELEGKYGDLLPWISRIIEEWLPQSGFKLQTTPTYVQYHRNHFIEVDECFKVSLCIPVALL